MNKDLFNENKQKIENKVMEILDQKIKEHTDNEFIVDSIKEIKRLSVGGKRVRGYLIKLGAMLFGVEDDTYISLAAAIEIFQTAILIHDDIIDKADKRRGMDTINAKYKGHIGISKAICIGDLGFFISYEIINDLNVSEKIKQDILKIYSKTLYNTVIGEIIDVELPLKNLEYHKHMNEEIIYEIYVNKTAWYTIIGPLLMGASLANTSEFNKQKIIEMGINLGIAFQIKDDLLGLYSTSSKVGKTINDVKEGKQTIIYKYAIEKANDEELLFIKQNYGNPDITSDNNDKIIDLFEKLGAKKHAEEKIEDYTKKAIEIINEMDVQNKPLFYDFADYLLKREN